MKTNSRRPLCPVCIAPLQRCICDLVTPLRCGVEAIIWQHPSETNHPKGTANLLTRSLPNSQLVIAKRLSQTDLLNLTGHSSKQLLLLFPHAGGEETGDKARLHVTPSAVRLLVLDGSWRKSRRLIHENPWLQSLPRFSLSSNLRSDYRIRKAEKPGQLSTLEATCAAIEIIEQNPNLCEPLRTAFRRHMERMAAFIPR